MVEGILMDKHHENHPKGNAAQKQKIESTRESILINSEIDAAKEASLANRWSKQRGYGVTSGGVNILLPVGLYSELVFKPVITALPNSPQYFIGLLNTRGNLIPVYDLAAFINVGEYAKSRSRPDMLSRKASVNKNSVNKASASNALTFSVKPAKTQQVIILGKGDDSAALLCDNLPQTFELSVNELLDKSGDIPPNMQPFLARTFWLNDEYWYELDTEAMFSRLAAGPSFKY